MGIEGFRMTVPAPSVMMRFDRAPGLIDPRATFTRATAATTYDRRGVQRSVPAGQPRWRYNPYTNVPQGLMLEEARTNLALRSEELDNAAWTKTNASISANSATAPDGATTADTITVSGASGTVNQAVTISAGNAVTISHHFRQITAAWALLRLTDGSNTVTAWFNLATGAGGTASAGGGNVVYLSHTMQRLAGGWWRCQLTVSTSVITSITGEVSAAAADNTEPATTNSVYAWGGQIESPGGTSSVGTYIPTTSATVTRNGDSLVFSSLNDWFNQDEGTLLLEWVGRESRVGRVLCTLSGSGGFNDSIYIVRTNTTQLQLASRNGGVQVVSMFKSYTLTDGTVSRLAMRYRANDVAWTLNGDEVGTDSAVTLPTFTRIAIGGDWSAAPGLQWSQPIRMAAYWPVGLSNAAMQTLAGS
jgi:hypothetical protein